MPELVRCEWSLKEQIYIDYHDCEWGVPEHDDARLFEKLILDGAQAGLSWITILKKREGYRQAFEGFDAERIARYTESDFKRLMSDAGIVRNRQKITAAISNARAYLDLRSEGIGFDTFLWSFVNGETIHNAWSSTAEIPARTKESEAMSKALLARGFKFVGPTICYAFMQAIGMVNDHLVHCHRYPQLKQ